MASVNETGESQPGTSRISICGQNSHSIPCTTRLRNARGDSARLGDQKSSRKGLEQFPVQVNVKMIALWAEQPSGTFQENIFQDMGPNNGLMALRLFLREAYYGGTQILTTGCLQVCRGAPVNKAKGHELRMDIETRLASKGPRNESWFHSKAKVCAEEPLDLRLHNILVVWAPFRFKSLLYSFLAQSRDIDWMEILLKTGLDDIE